jgi:hypothetical protein
MTSVPMASAQPAELPLGGPQIFVLDTGVLYDDIVYRLRHPESRGVLLGGATTGTIRLFAADHVYDELYDSLGGFERRRVRRDEFIRCLEQDYLPRLRFVTTPSEPIPARAAMVPDVDDRPTATLALLLAPCIVLAKDSHLVDAGFGRPDDWLPLAWQADELLGLDGTLLVGILGLGRAGRLAREGARWLFDDLSPRHVALGAALGAAVVMAAPQLAAGLHTAAQRAGRVTGEVAGGVAVGFAQVAVERGRRAARLAAAAVDPDADAPLAHHLARNLAVVDVPVTREELAYAFGVDAAVVASELEAYAAFVPAQAGWALGRVRAARSSHDDSTL